MGYSQRRLRYTIILFLAVMGLVISIMPKTPSAASSKQQTRSKSSSPVQNARNALERARTVEQVNPSEKANRDATEALKAYKSAVNARLAKINERLIELNKLREHGGDSKEIESESAALKREFKELRSSLTQYYQIQPETLKAKLSPAIPSGILAQFCNASPITINAGGPATPYPSNISISGETGIVTGVTVTLNNFGHTFPDDVDVLVVGPGGQNAIIMSDVGGGTAVSNITLTFDDAAATSLTSAPLVSGTFKPTNLEGGTEVFPPPAPVPSGGSALSVFNGTDPNGVWSLYVLDDTGGDGGTIAGGWCLNVTTEAGPPCVLTCPSDVTQANDPNQCGATVNYPAPTTTGTCGTVTCSPPSGSFFPIGTTTVTCTAAAGGSCSFSVTVTGTCDTSNVCNPTPITINTGGAATPYPSNITVVGQTGVVSHVTVTLNNFGHTFPDDVDVLLVGPGGQNAIIMSDVGGVISVSGVTLTLDDAAATNLPAMGPLVSGTFKPTNLEGGTEIFPAPAPVPSGGSALNVFNGTSPNGVWSLYVTDDTAGDGGIIAGGWCLNIMTTPVAPCTLTCPADITQPNGPGQCGAVVTYPAPTTSGTCGTVSCSPPSGSFFPIGTTTVTCTATAGGSCSFSVTVTGTCPGGCNPTPITISGGGPASPYPSALAISGLTGAVSHVTVTLNNFGHTFPDDVDVLLVGPGGQNAIIMSDVGGGTAVSNITLTFDDAAATSLTSAPLVSGTFKPTNLEPGTEVFPPPAPVPSGGSALSVFNGTNPNGVWSLYVLDDTAGDGGAIAGGWCLNVTTVENCTITCPSNVTQANDPNQCGAVVNYPPPTTTGSCGTVTCSPLSGAFFPVGTTTVTCTTQSGPSCSFTVTVNDTQPPVITCPPNQNVSVPIGQPCGVVNYPTATATDNCPGVAVVCNPPSGSCFPNGTTTVTCTATDASGNTASCSFSVSSFDICLQDDNNPSVVLRFNSVTGDYIFCCGGTVYTGNGMVTIKPNQIRLEDLTATIKLDAKVQTQANKGSATLQSLHGPALCDIKDKNLSNNTCACP
ncbi:MAG TPA: HYR domain-containing protein [Blastocatellia bacterium]|nr:HYR domain-containing protein [Blastocatellia bacterium]